MMDAKEIILRYRVSRHINQGKVNLKNKGQYCVVFLKPSILSYPSVEKRRLLLNPEELSTDGIDAPFQVIQIDGVVSSNSC